jgi:hypothetical protein
MAQAKWEMKTLGPIERRVVRYPVLAKIQGSADMAFHRITILHNRLYDS